MKINRLDERVNGRGIDIYDYVNRYIDEHRQELVDEYIEMEKEFNTEEELKDLRSEVENSNDLGYYLGYGDDFIYFNDVLEEIQKTYDDTYTQLYNDLVNLVDELNEKIKDGNKLELDVETSRSWATSYIRSKYFIISVVDTEYDSKEELLKIRLSDGHDNGVNDEDIEIVFDDYSSSDLDNIKDELEDRLDTNEYLTEGQWFDVLTTKKEPKKKDVVFSQDGFDVLRDKTKKGTFYSVYKDGYEVKLLPTVNNKDQDNVVNFLKNELSKGVGYSDWIRGINNMKDNIKGLSKRQVKKYLTASLTNEYFYRLEIGKDNISLGGIFTQIDGILEEFYEGNNEFEYDVAEDIDKNMFEIEEQLAVPNVNWKGYDSALVRCAFTKEGYDKFKENIDTIKGDLEDLGYKLIIKRVQPDEESIFFRDDLQIVYYDDIANVEPLDEKFDFYETFINKMDKDILDIIKTQPNQNKYVYNGKCSKSSGVNLVTAYNDPNTTDIYLVLGGLVHEDNKDKYKVGQDILHMWVEIDGEVIATNEPKDFVRVEKDRLKVDKTKDLYPQVEQFLSKHSVNETLYQDEKVKDKTGRDFKIWTECTGGYEGQEDYMKIAYLGDNWMDENDRVIRDNLLGIVEYAVDDDNKCYVQMIQVKDTEQRKGIATALIKSLQNEYKDIDYGYTTNDGTKLLKSLGIRESVQNYGYHAGDLGKSERREQQTGGRGTGHFGTGTYFVGNPDKIKNYNDYQYGKGKAPHHIVDFSSYNLYKPSNNYMGYKLHDTLKELNNGYKYYTQYADVYDWFINKGIDAKHTNFEVSDIPEIVSHLNNLLFDYDKIELPSDIDWDTIEDEYTQEDDRLTTELKPKYKDEDGYTEWGKLIDAVETELNKNPKFKEKNDTMYKVLDAISNELGERDLDKYKDIKRLPDKLYDALEHRHSKEEINKALGEVNKHLSDKSGDSLSTIFMKALGYDGVDVRHLNKDGNGWAGLDNTTYGSVIYDVKPETIVEELLTESKVMSDRLKGLIDKAYDYCKQAGWDFSNPQTFKSQMLVNYPLRISLGNETAHRLGLAKYPVKGVTEIVLAPQIDKFENDESILSVILHELGHIIAYDDDFAKGYVEYSDKYDQAIVRSKAIKKKLSHHGKRWKDVVEKLSKVSGISLQRLTNAEDTMEWNTINKDKYKYFFECPNCHCKLKYTRATDFVKTYDKDHPDGDPYWWCSICEKNTGKKIKFVKIDGGD